MFPLSLLAWADFLDYCGKPVITIVLITFFLISAFLYKKCQETDKWLSTGGSISINNPRELGATFIIHHKKYYTCYADGLSLYLSKVGLKIPRNNYLALDRIPQPPCGSYVSLYYNPDNPDEAVFNKGVPGLLIIASLCIGGILVWHIIFDYAGWTKSWNSE